MRRSRIGFDISDPRCAESSSQQIAARTAHVVWWTVRFGVTLALCEWPKISARFSVSSPVRLFYELASWPRGQVSSHLPDRRHVSLYIVSSPSWVPSIRRSFRRCVASRVALRETYFGGRGSSATQRSPRAVSRPPRGLLARVLVPTLAFALWAPSMVPRGAVCALSNVSAEASCSRSQSDVAPGGPSPRPAPHTSTSAELTSHERTTGSSAISRTARALNTRSQSARSPGSTSEGKRAAAMGCRSLARFADRRLGSLRGSSPASRAIAYAERNVAFGAGRWARMTGVARRSGVQVSVNASWRERPYYDQSSPSIVAE